MAERLVAVTGATGFLGGRLVGALLGAGWRVRLLARKDPTSPAWSGHAIEAVPGDLEDDAALVRLCTGAELVIHAAGLVKARHPQAFLSVNRDGTGRLVAACAAAAPGAHIILVSSLAARAPHLSPYAASKRAGEAEAARGLPAGASLTVVRPPAIYGPGDRETLGVFKAARLPLAPVAGPPGGRIALIHVDDAVAALLALAEDGPRGIRHYTLADGNPGGYAMAEIMAAAAAAQGTAPRLVRLPPAALHIAGHLAGTAARLLRRPGIFTPGKAREILHGDWSVHPTELPPATLWQPQIALDDGFAETVAWYRRMGWLR